MKKFLFPALALLTGALMLSFAGCSAGPNPYEVATREESEGIALAGSQSKSQARVMYEEARADGYIGSYVDFLKEIGISADDSLSVNAALLSVVEVYAGFSRSQSFSGQGAAYYSVGSGVIFELDKEEGDAYILTNYHIVYNAASAGGEKIPHVSDDISLYLYGAKSEAREISAEYLGGTMDYDIAVLKVEGSKELQQSDAQAVMLADSDAATVGERVYAIGNPAGKGISAVSGILSVDAEYITVEKADETSSVSLPEMRTDAPVNHGNSGGGLFNADGALIGVVNARSEESGVEHLGYAIPGNLACAIAENIIDNSKADNSHGAMRATLGITSQISDSRNEYDAETGKTRVIETITVQNVSRGIAYSEFHVGDVIRSIRINNGAEKTITRMHMIAATMFQVRKGDTVVFTLVRNGQTLTVPLAFTANNDFSLFR